MLMRAILALIVSCFFISAAAYAQSPAGGQQQTPPAQHQPGAVAKPAGSQPLGPQTLEPTAGKVDPAKEAAIRHLMEITGTSKLADQILGVVATRVHDKMTQRGLSPDRLQKFMDTFGQDLQSRVSAEQIDDAIIPIYSQHFSLEDIQGMTRFYESPLGQRTVKTMPQIYQEAQKAGSDLGQKGMLETLRGMTDEYPELKSMLPPEVGAKPTLAPSPAPAPVPSPLPAQQPPSPNPPHN
jgi:uncharacterized protein